MIFLVITSIFHHGLSYEHPQLKWVDTVYASFLTGLLTLCAISFGRGLFSIASALCGIVDICIYVFIKTKCPKNCTQLHMLIHFVGALGFVLFVIGIHRKEFTFQYHGPQISQL